MRFEVKYLRKVQSEKLKNS